MIFFLFIHLYNHINTIHGSHRIKKTMLDTKYPVMEIPDKSNTIVIVILFQGTIIEQ